MIKSRFFWMATCLVALLPWLAVDIMEYRLDWQKEVREELITVVQGVYAYDKQEKAAILDRVFERNQSLIGLMYVKGFLIIIMTAASVYFFRRYRRQHRPAVAKPVLVTIGFGACILAARIFLPHQPQDSSIRILSRNTAVSSLQQLHEEMFPGRVLYVDFWGTTCGPCLQEFRDFTPSLKAHYGTTAGISYLYIAQGNDYLWRKQIHKYGVKGEHLFLAEDQYANLYRNASGDTTSEITMPRYVILDKRGRVVETNAKRPSDKAELFAQLDKYLAPY